MSEPEKPKVILLVEDDAVLRNLVDMLLERDGHMVLTARDGQEALTLSRGYAGDIDLLITEVETRATDGLTLYEHVRRERPRTAVLLVSGQEWWGAGWPFLSKSFLPDDLRNAIDKLVV